MKNLLFAFLALFSFQFASAHELPVDDKIKIDPAKTTIEWLGRKVTGKHNGVINLKSGELTMTDGKLTGGIFEIDMTSITCTDLKGKGAGKLEGHLKSDDFFGVETHPTAVLIITDVSTAGLRGEYNVTADVTIKGITHPVSFATRITAESAMADIKIDRTKFDIKYGSGSFFDNLGDKAISDDFTLKVNIDLTSA